MLTLILSALLTMPDAGAAQRRARAWDCPPRDEAPQHADFLAFRNRLRRAVDAHDVDALLTMVDPGITTSFGPDNGLPFFKKYLEDKGSPLWHALADVLQGGGSFDRGVFNAPFWIPCAGSTDEVIVVGTGVRVRVRPERTAPVLTTVSYAVFEGEFEREGWVTVKLIDGRDGFVAERFVRSPIGYRAQFVKVDGVWRMTAFIGGD